MKIRDTHSLLLLLIILILSGCGDDDSDDDGTLNINEIVDNVGPAIGGGNGGGGLGGGFGSAIGDCTRVATINSDTTFNTELNAASCERQDFTSSLSGDEATDGYVVSLPSDGNFTILMSSADFDSVLFLYSCSDDSCSTLTFIDVNDDGGGGVNARDAEISLSLFEGTYLILASEFQSSEPDGDYVLTTSFGNGGGSL